ncbi:MAG TPA: TIGR03619 family F420-dependent LLM class oxidoreductase [bacterium]|nr:TIGR03619 family F420-dependent LLM class oxidoreductase [bacterium]
MPDAQFGVALENFCPAPAEPSIDAIVAYCAKAEALGFASAWAWDHILLGTKRPFPFLESLSTLTAVAMRTGRLALGVGVLVLPLRNPVVLAKELASLDQISNGRLLLGAAAGWYEREFQACGVPFAERGKIFVRNLEIVRRLWTEDQVDGTVDRYVFRQAAMRPKPVQRPHPPVLIGGYVDVVLRRVARHGDGWLTYFYTPESFRGAWAKIRAFAEEAGRDPAGLRNVSQLPICVAPSFEEADRRIRDFIGRYFDVAPWSQSTPDSAIRGTAAQCTEQLAAHLDAGVQHIVLVPDGYRPDQLEVIAHDVLPRLRSPGRDVPPGARPVHA